MSEKIFKHIINHPRWKDKTFIVATKKVGALKYFDRIVFMLNGSICYQGSFENLQKVKEFQDFMKIASSQRAGEKSLDQISGEVEKEEQLVKNKVKI